MIHLRPQRVYKPTTSSGNPNNSIANYLDRYYNQGLYRLRLETPRGTSLTEDNSQITCYAHFFNNTDGSEVTDRLKGRGFRPTWLLDGKSIDSVCISEEGYLLTLDSAHLTDYTQTVTLQALDTEILSALSDEPQFDIWLQQTLKGQGIQPTLLKQSETLINFALVNKKLKVGGRNLLLNSDKPLSNKEYYVGRYHISDPSLMVAGEYYTIQIWAAIEGADFSESIWVYNSGGNTEVANIQKLDNGVWQETFKWRDDSDKSNSYLNLFRGANHPNNKNSYNTTIKRIKLERGTVATDWTPAPEDVEESVSKVSTDLTLLERSLLDNDTGEIQKLKKLLGNHGKHFEELAKALAGKASTVDVQQSARDAIAEAIKRAGEMDKEIKVGGRNLIVTSRWKAGYLYGDRDENAYPVGSENYKVLVGYDTFRFDPVYIPTLGEREVTYKLYDNGGSKNGTVQIHAYDKDKKFLWWSVDGWNGTIGHTNAWTLPTDTAYIRLGVTNENVRAKVEFGTVVTDWTPAPEDRDEQIKALQKALDDGLENKLGRGEYEKWLEESYKKKKKEAEDKVNDLEKALEDKLGRGEYEKWLKGSYKKYKEDTESSLTNLKNVALTTQQREDLDYLTKSLQVLRSTDNKLEGVALQRHIALSGNGKDITAYLASNSLPAVLKAGITDFGTLNEREQVEITHQGTGHFGNLHFAGDQIDFRTAGDAKPYLSIGAWDMEPIDRFVKTTRVDDTPVSVYSLELSSKRKVYEQTISVANDGTRLTVHIDKLTCDCVLGSYAQLTLDGHLLTTWRGDVRDNDKGLDSGDFGLVDVPYRDENLSYERVVSAGTHTLRLEVVDKSRGGLALDGLTVRRYYDSGRKQSLLTKDGMRFFGSADRYFDVDYRSQIITGYKPIPGLDGELPVYEKNPYIVRIKGGAKVDKLTVDELDMPGMPLCGASFDERGTKIKSFGRLANRKGYGRVQAEYDYGMAAFKVYHSIGHTDYIPIVQVSGWASNDINWSLTPRVYNITSEYFVVRILTNNDNPSNKAISYVAYKTE